MNSSNIDKKSKFIKAWAPFALVLFTSVFMVVSIVSIISKNENVLHVDEVLHQVVKIEKMVVDMETATRGFLLTGKEYYLEPYNLALNKLDNQLAHLKNLVSGDKIQLARVIEIEKKIKEWDRMVAIPEITSRRLVQSGGIDAEYLQALITKKTGKSIQTRFQMRVKRLDDNFRKSNQLKGRFLALQVARSMVDIERGQRGYLLTGNDDFLAPYSLGKEGFLKNYKALVAYAKAQKKPFSIMKEIELLSQDQQLWLEKAGIPAIEARKKMNLNTTSMQTVLALVETEKGKNMMDKLRYLFAKINQEEQRIRDKHIQIATAVAHGSYFYTFIIAILAASLGYFTLKPKETLD
ncbi:MAG: CHASE3 domain-containing protein [SAR324 cluster bacterium]|nr:CHASE3 domain-containing protein [SAR324 cluster bacterium]